MQHHRRPRFNFDKKNGLWQWVTLHETPLAYVSLLLCVSPPLACSVSRFSSFDVPTPLFLPLRHLRRTQFGRAARRSEWQLQWFWADDDGELLTYMVSPA